MRLQTILISSPSIQTAEVPLDDYSKGVVFYHNTDGRIVGVLTWNLFGKMDAARKVKEAIASPPCYNPLSLSIVWLKLR